jgi:exonuclease SbcC
VADCLQALGREGFPDVGEGAALAELVEWAGALEEKAREVVASMKEELDTLELRQSRAEGKARALLQEHGYQVGAELEEALIDSAVRVRAAVREAEAARADVEPAAELDRVIALGEGLVANLGELCRLLTDGQFIGHVIERRQTNLLAVASEIMSSMTGRRYGFSADFRVVDRVSGQPRPTRTLSGGESFLASLALALGLVEMAARAGGKLDALFLDEGFGSLDANSLDEAMSALERHASSGQLVAVVSHIRAVAERIETVLGVTKTPLGSQVGFISGSERENYLEDGVEAGLLH